MSRFGGGGQRERVGMVVTLSGCALLLISMMIPVMRWSMNEHHATAGDARVWTGEGWTLADGGFGGAWFLPVSSAAVIVLAAATLFGAWRTQVTSALVAGYVPAWTALAFVRKLEDDVGLDVGAGVLLIGSLLVAAGLWLSRDIPANRSSGDEEPTAGRPEQRNAPRIGAPTKSVPPNRHRSQHTEQA